MDDGPPTMTWRFPLTFAALTVAAAVLAAALVGHVTLIALPASLVARIEPDEIGAIVLVLLLLGVAFVADQILVSRQIRMHTQLAAERLQVAEATVRAVQDIVNDGLNQLQLLRFDAEGHVPAESLALFDEAIRDTVTRLTALDNLQAKAEKELIAGAALDSRHVSVLR